VRPFKIHRGWPSGPSLGLPAQINSQKEKKAQTYTLRGEFFPRPFDELSECQAAGAYLMAQP
jgi:hypothetical protein